MINISIVGNLSSFPNDSCNKIFLSENFVHHEPKVVNLMVVNTDEDHPVVTQELASEEKTRLHH